MLEKNPTEQAAEILYRGIYMSGGGYLIRNFPVLLSQHTHLSVRLAENPLLSVVIGAGMAMDQLKVLKKIEKAER